MPTTRVARVAVSAGLAWLLVYEVAVLAGLDLGPLSDRGAHDCLLVLASAVCLGGALRHRGPERVAWLLLAAGVAAWTAGEVYYTVVLWTDPSPPVPSPADAGYLLFPPLAVAGFVLLARAHHTDGSTTVRVDGVIAALAVGSLCAAIVIESVGAADALALAYPLADLVLLGVLVGTLTRRHWVVDRTWMLLIAGVLLFFLADSFYAVRVAHGTYESGGWFDAGWWAGLFTIGIAAQQQRCPTAPLERSGDAVTILAPLLTGVVGLGVLVVSAVQPLNLVAVSLAAAALCGVMVRLLLTFREFVGVLRTSQSEATCDALTGLGNRRGLERSLSQVLSQETPGDWVLGIFDLNGFKTYNDTFGHPEGDALLVRLGARLGDALGDRGSAFRMGGDEFCVLACVGPVDAEPELERLREVLFERADGFDITSAVGAVRLGGEVADAATALRIADQRMYAEKAGGRLSAPRQSAEVLKRALAEHGGFDGGEDAGSLAAVVARRLGLSPAEVQDVRLATELRDVGLIAVPDEVLAEPGGLSEEHWAILRRHTLLGERIIAAAPALSAVGRLVRSSHEHYDGTGYPDGLAREDIPRGARVVCAVDAFEAQLRPRPHAGPRTPAQALAELQRCSGTVFDPVVVAALIEVIGDPERSGWNRPLSPSAAG